MTVIPVDYVSGQTLVKLMEGFATKPGRDPHRPVGQAAARASAAAPSASRRSTPSRNFDVDWLRGQSVGIYPIRNSAPEPIVAELEKIMDSGDAGLGHNLVKFQAIARQNAIMVVAARPELLRTAASWIARLDSLGRRQHRRQGLQGQLRRRQADRRAADRDFRQGGSASTARQRGQPDRARLGRDGADRRPSA